jgi:hypothetical protein
MKFTMEIKVGKNSLSITEECENTKDLFKKAGFYGTIPSACGNCESTDLMLNHRCAQDKYDYYSVDCKNCGHRLNYGQHLNEDTLFAKLNDGWEPPYKGDSEEEDKPKRSTASKLAKLQKNKKKVEEEEEDSEEYENTEVEEKEEAPKAKKTTKSAADIINKYKNRGN